MAAMTSLSAPCPLLPQRLRAWAPGLVLTLVLALVAMALLSEHLSAVQWLAIGCIMAASMGSAITATRPAAADLAAPQAA